MTVPVSPAAATARPTTHEDQWATPLGVHAAVIVNTGGHGPATALVTGDLDLACADMLTAALCHVLETHPMGLEVDLTGVEFFDSAALRSLERVRAYAELRGRRLVLDYWSSAVDLVFELAAAFETTHGPVG